MIEISRHQIDTLPKRERTALVNSLSGFKSAQLVGTADKNGNTNLSLVSSVIHVGAAPPLLGFLVRPHTVPRHTLENLLELGEYTLNAVSRDLVPLAHASSARYPKEISEFEANGLTAEYSKICKAPYVAESPVQIGLRLVEHHTLDVNGCVMVVGEIAEVRLSRDTRADDGHLDLVALDVVTIAGLDEYFAPASLGRLPYAKAP